MEAVQKEYWYFLVLVSLTFLKVSEQLRAPVSTVRLQEGMMLDCLCPWTGRLSMVSWTKQPDQKPLAIYHPEFGVNFGAPYEGRVEFVKASSMDGSIIITNVTEEDLGLYRCSLQTFPQGSWTKDTLVENKLVISTTSSAHPHTELIVPESENLTIICKAHAGAVSEVSIEKLWSGQEGSTVLAVCKALADNVGVTEFADRIGVNCTDDLEMSVHLNDVMEKDGGLYRCNFSMATGTQDTSLIVLTTIPNRGLRNLHNMMYIYVGGGVAGAFVLMSGVLLLTWLSRRRRRRREEYRIQLHPAKRRNWRNMD
ncbi:CD226 antigen isoform X2 [Colossoma macropomum]|uniref:CD226 antigen isoform X2 n=1 Tax=Colossoma macropomum TaxID=42526 RepID=UPI001863CD11|nr:CD226 antigen isoform X2 [Colossoma macropomum]